MSAVSIGNRISLICCRPRFLR